LVLFSLFSMHSCAIWNTWGPIAKTAKQVYGWSDGTITMYTLWGCLDFPLFFLPSAWLLGRSLRLSVVVAVLCMVFGAVVRCLPQVVSIDQDSFDILCNIGAFVNAMAGPIAMSAPIQISSAWFPPMERTFATSIGQMFNALGVGESFVMGTLMVTSELERCDGASGSDTAVCLVNVTQAEAEINLLLVVEAGVAVAIALLVLLYFPSDPPLPPSLSASQPRIHFMDGFKVLVKSKTAWLTMLVYSLSQGLVQMWQSVMVINLTDLKVEEVSENWASTLGIVISFVAVAASILFAATLKFFKNRMKLVIMLLLSVSGAIFILATLLFQGVIKFDKSESFFICTYVFLLTGISLACASAPILFEFSVELCYPIAEGCIGTWLTLGFNILSVLFFLVFQIPGVGTGWLSYMLPVCCLGPVPLLMMLKETYNRLDVDESRKDSRIVMQG